MKTAILAGGFGSRLAEETEIRPKPMVEVGNKPMLWHIMNIYSAYGYNEFVIACGYKGESIKEYFANFYLHNADVTIDLKHGNIDLHAKKGPDWKVTLVDTGLGTQTGGRIKRLKGWLGDKTFMMTYGDGVGDVDISALIDFHRSHGRLATITAVRQPARFGNLDIHGGQVKRFLEKPIGGDGWINGGFMVLEPGVLDYIDDDDTSFEKDALERLAEDGQLMSYSHSGFWQAMDTLREKYLLEDLWNKGEAPWKVWK